MHTAARGHQGLPGFCPAVERRLTDAPPPLSDQACRHRQRNPRGAPPFRRVVISSERGGFDGERLV